MKYVIIGGTSGIGEALVRRMVEHNHYVVFYGRNVEKGKALEQELGSSICSFHQLDISSDTARKELTSTLSESSELHGCFNFAGVMYLSKLLDLEIDDWIAMAKVNYIGLLNAIAAIVPKLARGSLFMNVSSVAALHPSVGNAAYAASKRAADIIIDVLRKECVSGGIKVGTVHLGGVDTDINDKIRNDHMRRTIKLRTKTYTPMSTSAVVDQMMKLLETPASINIADIFITPTDQPD